MSTRCRHDLGGAISQLQSTLNRWRESQLKVAEAWDDSTAQNFQKENLSQVEESITRTISRLQEATELVRSIEKRVHDSDGGDGAS